MNAGSVVQRSPPADPALVQDARSRPGEWLFDVDRTYPADQPVPPEAIRGAWKIGADGRITDEFTSNARYRAVERCARKLKPHVHAAARRNRDQWITEIDPRGEDLFSNIPAELVRGWWYVDAQGVVSSDFRPNSLWRPAERPDAVE